MHVYCPECGFQNLEGANYCAKCGALLLPEQPGSQTTTSFAPPELESDTAASPLDHVTDVPALVIRAGGGRAGEHFVLRAETTSIGRSPDGRHHARRRHGLARARLARRREDGLYIEDRDSLNGTYVNRQRIESHRLSDGDELQIGKFKLTFLDR